MLKAFVQQSHGLTIVPLPASLQIPAEAIWLDLLDPTPAEEKAVEDFLRIDVPTREEMKEIETSNRLYEENGALYMTATVAARLDSERPEITAATFILANGRLVTTRYIDTKPFQQFSSYAEKHPHACQSAVAILAGLIESLIERIADTLERVGGNLDQVSGSIFISRDTPNSRATERYANSVNGSSRNAWTRNTVGDASRRRARRCCGRSARARCRTSRARHSG